MASAMFDDYLGPLQERDEKKRKQLVRKLTATTVLFWLGFAAFLAAGIALIVHFNEEDLAENAGRIAGIVLVCLSVLILITGSILISVVFMVKEAIDEAEKPKLFRSEELRDVFYPRQRCPPPLKPLIFSVYESQTDEQSIAEDEQDEPPPAYEPPANLPVYPGSPVNERPPWETARLPSGRPGFDSRSAHRL